MRCVDNGLSLLVGILVAGCLAAGCGSSVTSAISGVTSKAATASVSPATTVTATATETATSPAAAATTPASATSPGTAASGSGTNLLWLWILLGALVLAGLITWIARPGRRRSANAAGWQSRLIDAYAKGSALHDAMSAAEMPGDPAVGDARARWHDIQQRADDLAQMLYALREAAPDPGDQVKIADVLASLQAVRSAMDAERAPGGAVPQQADVVHSRLYDFESSLRALRTGDQEFG